MADGFTIAEERIEEARRNGSLELDLAKLELTTLPEAIGELRHLKGLDLSRNRLAELPDMIRQLEELKTLSIGDNPLTTLPDFLGSLPLRQLYVTFSPLVFLPSSIIGKLTQLRGLNLTATQLRYLPETIGNLNNLEYLDLAHNQLFELPESIGGLSQLQYLLLDFNQLVRLPDTMRKLSALRVLLLHGNDHLGIPAEILGDERDFLTFGENRDYSSPNPAEILDYYFRTRRERSLRLNEAKILVVGQGGVGKTSLVKRLVGEPFDPLELKTEGIHIDVWEVPGQGDPGHEDETVKLNLWDFGGQEIMHATHQFFLTKRSLYLVVLDARKGENESNIQYWLKIIQSYGSDSPVLVVTNKVDAHQLELNERRLRLDYEPNIRGFFKVSAAQDIGIAELRDAIIKQVHALPHVFDELPESYFIVKRELQRVAASKDLLAFEEYQDICRAHGLDDERDHLRLIRFLHDLGAVLNFDDPSDPYQLHDTNILNPEWVTQAVYRIINSDALAQREGEVEVSQLGRILGDNERYPEAYHGFIIDVMRKFELCFDFEGSQGQRLLIPELLPKNEPAMDWDEADALNFQFDYSVLPTGLICRFIVKLHGYLGPDSLYWRSGVVLDVNGNRTFVRADTDKHRIFVSIRGPSVGRAEALVIIRNAFREIHVTIPRLDVTEKVPLPDDRSIVVSHAHLLRLQGDGVEEFLPEGARKRYRVQQLLTGIEDHTSKSASTPTVLRVELRNIRCFEYLDLDLSHDGKVRPWTILLGVNGVGKTTILRSIAIGLCEETSAAALMEELSGEMLREDADEGSIYIELSSEQDGSNPWTKTRLIRNAHGTIELQQEVSNPFPRQKLFACGYGALRRGLGSQTYRSYALADSIRSLFDYDAPLQNPELTFRRLESAGARLEDITHRLEVILRLQKGSIRIDGTGISMSGPWGQFVPIGAIGDGYQATLAWIADLFGWALFFNPHFLSDDISGIVLIDEVEKHLHPSWQREIIRELHEQFPRVQFIATTHSPICVGGLADLEPGDGIMFYLDGDEVEKIEPLTGWRYDQIMTSSAFGVSSARDMTTERVIQRLREIYEQSDSTGDASEKLEQAMAELRSRSVQAAEDEEDRRTRAELAKNLAEIKAMLGSGETP